MNAGLRAPTEDDVGTVARLMSQHSPESIDDERVRLKWSSPTVELDGATPEPTGRTAFTCDRFAQATSGRSTKCTRKCSRTPWEPIEETFEEWSHHLLSNAGLGVDAESPTGAVQLYESAGMGASAQFEIREKVVA